METAAESFARRESGIDPTEKDWTAYENMTASLALRRRLENYMEAHDEHEQNDCRGVAPIF